MTATFRLEDEAHRSAAEARNKSLEAFLAGRGLTRAELAEEAQRRGGFGEVYFVSTIVCDLAGSTSDIDMIVVSDEAQGNAPHMSTMAFFKQSRLGVKQYGRVQADHALMRLAGLAGLPAQDLATGLERWDGPVPLIDTERLINGITTSGACPLIGYLPDLCATRFAISFDLFRESLISAALARRAGEVRAPWGYLLHALPHLMDAVLAREGSVVTNAKWAAQRWRQSASRREPRWGALDEWWDRAWLALRNSADTPEVDALTTFYQDVVDIFGIALPEDADVVRWRNNVVTSPFGSQVWLSRDDGGRLVLHPTAGLRESLTFADLTALDGREASTLLSAARAGFVSNRLREARLSAPRAFAARGVA